MMGKVFEAALGIAAPWSVASVDFDEAAKVLTGSVPGELAVQAITRYELIVNLNTARQIGASIPPELLGRADRVIR